MASHNRLRRAARRRRRRTGGGVDRPGLRPPPSTPNYRPTQDQDRHIRTRDRTCRHFGCTRKAIHADIDHHQPHPDGPTAVCNLCCYCRTHHRLKHQAPGWTRHFQPDATLTIVTPTGNTRTTRPPGPEPDWPLPALTTPSPASTPISTPISTPDNDPPPF